MTKKKQTEITKDLLHKAELTREDKRWLYRLFENHPEWTKKKGVGIKDIVRRKTMWGNRCFYLIRKDNSETDISYKVCIIGKPTKLAEIKKACRYAVTSEVMKVANAVRYGVDTCPVTGDILTKGNTHIDHYNLTFAELFKKWVKQYDIDMLHSLINRSADGDTTTRFVSAQIEKDFIAFHNANTHLRAVTKEANLNILTKKSSK